jgi:hypothetical protein
MRGIRFIRWRQIFMLFLGQFFDWVGLENRARMILSFNFSLDASPP